VIAVPRPLLSGLQSGVTKRLRENLLVKIKRSPTAQPRGFPKIARNSRSHLYCAHVPAVLHGGSLQRHAITPLASRRAYCHTYICASRASFSAPIQRLCLVAGCTFTRPTLRLLPATSNRLLSSPSRLCYRDPQAAVTTPLMEYACICMHDLLCSHSFHSFLLARRSLLLLPSNYQHIGRVHTYALRLALLVACFTKFLHPVVHSCRDELTGLFDGGLPTCMIC
jgi:hypothetical protein